MNGLVQTLRNLGTVRLAAMAVVAAVTIAFFAFLTTRLATPGYGLLYSDLNLRDSGQIAQKLDAMNVPYQLRGDGTTILVPTDQVARVRMAMAEQGLPQGGSVGYEIFDKSNTFGTSSFVQNIDKVRALEGELARSISSINLVEAARVHLVLPQRELFARERQTPTASIVVKLRGPQGLTRIQVAAIQHLVAAAVPGLQPTRVSIIDTNGNLLARGDGASADSLAGSNADEVRVNYENHLARNVQELLERSLGPGKVRVDVHADMDFDRTTTNSETYDPNGQVARSTQTVTQTSNSSDSGDQPVTVSTNLPNSQTATSSSGGKSQSSRNEETTNYEISKTVTSQVREGGTVKRLSVAVLLDGTYTTVGGKRTYHPRSAAEIQQITSLVKSAIGYDAKRGDTVDVVNLPFAGVDEPMPSVSSTFMGFEKSDLVRLGETLVLALVALLVLLLVIRPLINRIIEGGAAANNSGNDLANLLTGAVAGTAPPALPAPNLLGQAPVPAAGGNSTLAPTLPKVGPELSEMIDIGQVEGRVAASSIRKVGEIVEKHPEEAVAIMRSWMYQGA